MLRIRPVVFALATSTLVGCVSSGKYDAAINDANSLRAKMQTEEADAAKRDKDNADAIAQLKERVKALEADVQDRDAKLADLSTSSHNLQAKLDESTAISEKLRAELTRLGQNVDKMLAEKGTLSKSLDDAKARLEELRKAEAAAEARAALFKDLAKKLHAMVDSGQLKIVTRHGHLVFQLSNDVLFDSGGVEVKPAGKAAIAELARTLKGVTGRQFQVAGHTDNVPISGRFPSNWELSAARATHVLKILLAEGVPPQALSAAGYGEFDPLAPNDTAEAKAKNRRTEITLQPNIDELISLPDLK